METQPSTKSCGSVGVGEVCTRGWLDGGCVLVTFCIQLCVSGADKLKPTQLSVSKLLVDCKTKNFNGKSEKKMTVCELSMTTGVV